MKHKCEGLVSCLTHPRWHVIGYIIGTSRAWSVYSPELTKYAYFPTFDDAIIYAQRMTRLEVDTLSEMW